jgi:hypothetical protein
MRPTLYTSPPQPITLFSCPVATTSATRSMSSLPSFVELMSSLGLEDGAPLSRSTPSFLRPRSRSNASSSSDTDDEREVPHQPHAATGAYLFIPADHDRHDSTSSMDIEAPRVSRHSKGRYSPYSIDSVRIRPSQSLVLSSPTWFPSYCRSHGKEASPLCSNQKKRRGYVVRQTNHTIMSLNPAIDTLHLAAALSPLPRFSGTKIP